MLVLLVGVAVAIAFFAAAELVRRFGPKRVEAGGERSIASTLLLVVAVLVFITTLMWPMMHTFVSSFALFPFRVFHHLNPFRWF